MERLGHGARATLLGLLAAFVVSAGGSGPQSAPAVRIASRLEPFVDHALIDRMTGARLELGRPQPAGVAFGFDRPWESDAGYATVLYDAGRYRLYYRGVRPDRGGLERTDGSRAEVTCYAESRDGSRWTKPNLALFEVAGTRDNNVVLADLPPFSHNFTPLIDRRPGVAPAERYKALSGKLGPGSGVAAFVSSDGLRWRRLTPTPVMGETHYPLRTDPSSCAAFWSETEGKYVAYLRIWVDERRRMVPIDASVPKFRWIGRATSDDFVHWTKIEPMDSGPAPLEHLYTSQTHPYFRAPHIYIAFPRRFMPGQQVLSEQQVRTLGLEGPGYYRGLKKDTSDGVFMTSRGGMRYDRTFMEAFIRPGTDLRNWVSRANTAVLGVVPTGPGEMSLYVARHKGQPSHHLERLALRLDGFASVHAPYEGGEMITRPLEFSGRELVVNYSTSAAGSLRVELQEASGAPIAGRSLADAEVIIGDEIERVVGWRGGRDVGDRAGQPTRVRFVMKDADLYSIRFR